MDCNHYKCCVVIFSFCLFTQGLSASTLISDGIFESQHAGGRNLLQAKKSCSVNFEYQNYTIITSQCKGPQYPAKLCCPAFKEFACPFSQQLNDLTNDCANTMFSYINHHGNYPPGLFANSCKEGKLGLECPAPAPSQLTSDTSGQTGCNPSYSLILIGVFLVYRSCSEYSYRSEMHIY